ncbi:hypothetical protein AX16_007902 [Volvariella volvacea WC 439]|nr:hypothetical protein AX16_007902 [Volvariella volvacea WC 439]
MQMQAANLQNLPENYSLKFWIYNAMSWPQISFVAEGHKGRVVGYVLAKIIAARWKGYTRSRKFHIRAAIVSSVGYGKNAHGTIPTGYGKRIPSEIRVPSRTEIEQGCYWSLSRLTRIRSRKRGEELL